MRAINAGNFNSIKYGADASVRLAILIGSFSHNIGNVDELRPSAAQSTLPLAFSPAAALDDVAWPCDDMTARRSKMSIERGAG